MFNRHEPIVFRWTGGTASVGYLGAKRWRVKLGRVKLEAEDVTAAVRVVFDALFDGVATGQEADLDPGREWGRDSMTRRPGAGLHITRYEVDDDEVEEPPPDVPVCVEFKIPE